MYNAKLISILDIEKMLDDLIWHNLSPKTLTKQMLLQMQKSYIGYLTNNLAINWKFEVITWVKHYNI